jgi:hypothetical protein
MERVANQLKGLLARAGDDLGLTATEIDYTIWASERAR